MEWQLMREEYGTKGGEAYDSEVKTHQTKAARKAAEKCKKVGEVYKATLTKRHSFQKTAHGAGEIELLPREHPLRDPHSDDGLEL